MSMKRRMKNLEDPNSKKRLIQESPEDSVSWTIDQKKQLAGLVREQTLIWKLDDPLHKNPTATDKAWNKIATAMKFSASECRRVWRSMANSLSYHMKNPPKKKKKSGDSGPDDSNDDSLECEEFEVKIQDRLEAWEFGSCMEFLNTRRAKRSTSSYPEIDSEDCHIIYVESADESNVTNSAEDDQPSITTESAGSDGNTEVPHDESVPVPGPSSRTPNLNSQTNRSVPTKGKGKSSNYSYMGSRGNKGDSEEKKMLTGLTELIELRKSAITQTGDELKYKSIYVNLDRMLRKLPADIVEDLNMQFTNMAYTELKKIESGGVIDAVLLARSSSE